MITAAFLQALCPPMSSVRAQQIAETLEPAAVKAGITTRLRTAAFTAQLAHESMGFLYREELWGPTPAQRRYEGRVDLGNTFPGDGYRYRGRAWLQLTGRANYRRVGQTLNLPLEADPDLATSYENAAAISAEYWRSHNLNALADREDIGPDARIDAITSVINGGYNGRDERRAYYRRALDLLHDVSAPTVVEPRYLYSQDRDPDGTLLDDWTSILVDAQGRVLLAADGKPRTYRITAERAAAKGLT